MLINYYYKNNRACNTNEDEKSLAQLAQKALQKLYIVTLKNTSIDKYGRILADVYDENNLP